MQDANSAPFNSSSVFLTSAPVIPELQCSQCMSDQIVRAEQAMQQEDVTNNSDTDEDTSLTSIEDAEVSEIELLRQTPISSGESSQIISSYVHLLYTVK